MNKSAPCHCCTGNTTFTARGCGKPTGLVLPGVTVSVDQPSGTVVASGTTDSSGIFRFDVNLSSGYFITVSKSRFVTQTLVSETSSNRTPSITLAPDTASYHCSQCCADPLTNTLHVSSTCGSFTITWSATYTAWVGCVACSGGTIDNNCNASSGTTPFYVDLCGHEYQTCGVAFAGFARCCSGTPKFETLACIANNSGGAPLNLSNTVSASSCPPSFSMSFSAPSTITAFPCSATSTPYSGSVTITE